MAAMLPLAPISATTGPALAQVPAAAHSHSFDAWATR